VPVANISLPSRCARTIRKKVSIFRDLKYAFLVLENGPSLKKKIWNQNFQNKILNFSFYLGQTSEILTWLNLSELLMYISL